MTGTCKSPGCVRKPANGGHGWCRPHARLHGHLLPRVPAEKALAELDRLTANGATPNAVCIALGWTSSRLTRLTTGRCKTVNHALYDSLRNLDVEDVAVFEAWPYQRRLRSLRAAGISAQALADETGIEVAYITKMCIAPPTARINKRTMEGIEAAWRRHQNDPVAAPSPQVSKRNWVPPMWWDNIDNPEEKPGVTHCVDCHDHLDGRNSVRCLACAKRRNKKQAKQRRMEAA